MGSCSVMAVEVVHSTGVGGWGGKRVKKGVRGEGMTTM